jgi:V8-like Glu-specific endopeptidase
MTLEQEFELDQLEQEFEATGAGRPAPTAAVPCPRGSSWSALRPVDDVTKDPFRWVCRIKTSTSHGTSYGTGVLISRWHVLTVAHVIYPREKPLDPKKPYNTLSIEVGPGYGAATKPALRSNGWAVSPRWKIQDCATAGYDLGLIRLSQPVSPALGNWALASFAPGDLQRMPCLLAGYPSDANRPVPVQMYRSTDQIRGSADITSCTPDGNDGNLQGTIQPLTQASLLLLHNADSFGAMSGGPICVNNGGRPWLVAIHARAIANGKCKVGVLLTQGVQAQIRNWMNGSMKPMP